MKTRIIVDDGAHNGFPDLIHWQDHFYLAYRAARNHIDPNSCIKILRSSDTENWELLAQLELDDEDIRDPKLCAIHGRIFLYALKNKNLSPMPHATVYSTSGDGRTWSAWQPVSPGNWVFWRPKTCNDRVWYVAADNRSLKQSALFSSTDGITWDKISTIYDAEFNAEIELAFLPNQAILCTIRVEGFEGDPKTLIGCSEFPYEEWALTPSRVTRLDGAASFTYRERIFSIGRFEPKPLSALRFGNLITQKRTSLFHTQGHTLAWLADLPSSGDTGYAAVVVQGDTAFVAYYTSEPGKDYPWAIGQFNPTQIRLATIDLAQTCHALYGY